MGCDIHCHVEVKDKGNWRKHAPLVKNPWYRPEQEQTQWNTPEIPEEGYGMRNYDLFAILANVRNGYGFAGIKTGDGFVPISLPKGLPDDCDAEIRKSSDEWGCDGHSHSYIDLKEILDYDWERVTKQQGVLSPDEYEKWDKKSVPQSYSGACWGKSIVTVTEQEYLLRKANRDFDPLLCYYVACNWVTTYRDTVGDAWWSTVDRLKQYAEQFGGPENVRLTFWFDN